VHSIIAPRKCLLRPENATVALGYCLDFPELSLDPVSKPDSLILQSTGNGLINEAEFLQWVGRIQALRDDQQSHEDSKDSKPVDEADDVTEDLIAAFRYTQCLWCLAYLLFLQEHPPSLHPQSIRSGW